MKKLYLSGAITNNPFYKRDFKIARERLLKAGYTDILNPLEFCDQSWDWCTCMRKCLQVIVQHKDLGIAVISDCTYSRGRELGLEIAECLNLEICNIDGWVEWAEKLK